MWFKGLVVRFNFGFGQTKTTQKGVSKGVDKNGAQCNMGFGRITTREVDKKRKM